jgi:hypothetical protein
VDDDLRPVTVEAGADPVGCIKVERIATPGDGPGRTGEGSVRQGGDERAAEAAARSGDGDTHQSRVGALAAAASPVANRWPY